MPKGSRTRKGVPNPVTPEQIAAEERFAEEYVIDRNAKRAMQAAGQNLSNGKTAASMGHRVLKRPRVIEMIRIKRLELSQRTGLTAEWVERELMALAVGAKHENVRLGALEKLGRRLPDFFGPEKFDVTAMTPEQREEAKRLIVERAAARAKLAQGNQ